MSATRTDESDCRLRPPVARDALRRRAIITLLLFLFLGPALFAPVVKVEAHAEGLWEGHAEREWRVRFEAWVGAAGAYQRTEISKSDGAQVPAQAHAALNRFRQIHTPMLGNWWSLVFVVGAGLSLRRRDGALYGGLAAFLGLGSVLAIVDGVRPQIYAFGTTYPLAFTERTTSALAVTVLAWSALLGWCVLRRTLDRREEHLAGALIGGEVQSESSPSDARGIGPLVVGGVLGAGIVGALVLLASLPFLADCNVPEPPLDCTKGNVRFLLLMGPVGGYIGAVVGSWLGLRWTRRSLPVLTAFIAAVILPFFGIPALIVPLAFYSSLPLGLVLLAAALVAGLRLSRALALWAHGSSTQRRLPTSGARS